MPRINVCQRCVIEADFVFKNRTLTENQQIIFRSRLATGQGVQLLEHIMQPEKSNGSADGKAILRCSLQNTDVLPGTYTWELLLQDEDGTMHCLLPEKDNLLCVHAAVQEDA